MHFSGAEYAGDDEPYLLCVISNNRAIASTDVAREPYHVN